jgi:hypothetical protein
VALRRPKQPPDLPFLRHAEQTKKTKQYSDAKDYPENRKVVTQF